MSDKEKNERLCYRRWRNKGILIQLVAVLLLTAITGVLIFCYYRANQALYLSYTESSDINYRVYLSENEFYEESYLKKGQLYLAELVDHIEADISYDLAIAAENVRYDYAYMLDAVLEIKDKESGKILYCPTYILKEKTTHVTTEKVLSLRDKVTLSYPQYEAFAEHYIETYKLRNVTCTLIIRANIGINASCPSFAENHQKDYVTELHIPLNKAVFDIETHASVPQNENRILANNKVETDTLKMFMFMFAFLTVALWIALVLFMRITKNKHIEYTAKVQRLVANYKSYIQKINNVFDPSGYQILSVNSFIELLEIRDTLQAPILMLENKDKTATKFIVPTSTRLLYLYEIKMEE